MTHFYAGDETMCERDALNANHTGGVSMDRETLEKLARLKADRDEIADDINRLVIARSETKNEVIDKMLLARMDRKWAEMDHITRNIRNVELGHPEVEWSETDLFEDLGPEDGVSLH
jgi:hypothetical protein